VKEREGGIACRLAVLTGPVWRGQELRLPTAPIPTKVKAVREDPNAPIANCYSAHPITLAKILASRSTTTSASWRGIIDDFSSAVEARPASHIFGFERVGAVAIETLEIARTRTLLDAAGTSHSCQVRARRRLGRAMPWIGRLEITNQIASVSSKGILDIQKMAKTMERAARTWQVV
jgi:hypothetical protein